VDEKSRIKRRLDEQEVPVLDVSMERTGSCGEPKGGAGGEGKGVEETLSGGTGSCCNARVAGRELAADLRVDAGHLAGADADAGALEVATVRGCASAAETARDRLGARLATGTCCTVSTNCIGAGLGPTIDVGLIVGVEVVREGARLNLAEGSRTGMETSIFCILSDLLDRTLFDGLTW